MLTLPVETNVKITPRSIRITSGNGFIGNSDIDVTTNNIKPEFIFDKNADTWFEYEKLDSGPAQMSLTLDFPLGQIVNTMAIRAVNLGAGLNYEIEDIIFSISGSKTVSIKDLVGPALKPEDFIIKTIGNDLHWSITFLPVTCTNITIKFKQDNYYRVEMLSSDGRPVTRKRFPIGIKSMAVSRKKFRKNGGISSTYYTLPSGLYAAQSSSKIFPRKNNLYSAFLDLSVDNGESWDLDVFGFENSQTPDTVTMDGTAANALWRLQVQRNDDAFKDITSYTDEEIATTIEVFSRRVSPAVSPALIHLRKKPYNKEVGVFQPRICRRTDDEREAIQIGRSPTGTVPGEGFVLPLPIELDREDYNLDPEDMVIYAARREVDAYVDEESGETLSFAEVAIGTGSSSSSRIWAINDNWTRIAMQVLREHSPISWRFPSKRLFFEQRSDGYYAEFSERFDPDKKRIRLSGLAPYSATTSEVIPSSVKVFNLKYKQVVEGSVSLSVESGVDASLTLTEKDSYVEVRGAASSDMEIYWYLDHVNGKLYLNKELSNWSSTSEEGPILVKITYKHVDPKIVEDEDYKIWSEGIKLKGVIINPDKLVTKDIDFSVETESFVTANPTYIIDPTTGASYSWGGSSSVPRPFAGKAKGLDLPYDYIIKNSIVVDPGFLGKEPEAPAPVEVEYVDGKTEFLGLINMDYESTVETTSDFTSIVKFKLAAGSAWFDPLGVDFEDTEVFKTNKGSDAGSISVEGDYTIDANGVVSIKVAAVGQGVLKGGISYTYSYVDPSFDSTNLISVDYEKGIIYASEKIQRGAYTLEDGTEMSSPVVKFKVARYKAEYDIVRKIDSFSYNPGSNVVSVNTENIRRRLNRRVKVYYAIPDNFVPLKDMKDYFSPLIYNISFRFQ